MIELKNVSKIYRPFKNGESVGLKNINLTFKDKGLVFIVGKSGSGKSTLLNLLGTLDKPTSGEIIINGKNLSKLKEKEIDSYRSHYIGSIFQEFNLLEDFDVYSNIELSANLKKAKVKKDVIDKLLDVVGISGKGTRKINELSGGEKARVGIARALVKNPNIILADEPTGNLDTNTTAEIIKILKTISLNKLVIVVTHDVNMALDYADRIIELKDGSVLKDEVYNDYEIINSTLDLKKTKLPLPVSIKLALKNLKIKKGKLIITTFLVTFALSTFALAMSLTNYDTSLAHAKVMVKNNESNVTIKKTIDGKIQNEKYFISYFKDEDLRNIDSLTTHPYSKKMILSSNNSGLQLTLGELEESETYLYYDLITDKNQYIIEMPSSELNELDIIGSIPKNNEILIHKLFADYIIHYGINVEGYDINKGSIIELYKPNSYEEIINSDKNYIFGNKRVKISGIINDDLTQYDKYKNLTYLDIEDDKTLSNLYSKLNKKSDEWLNYFVTSDQFLNNIKLEENTLLDNDRYLIRYLYNNEKYENGSAISNYTGEVPIDLGITDSCYDGNEFIHLKDFESLNEDEIIINASLIDSITNKKYTEIVKRISEEYKNDFSSYEINNYHDIYVYALEEIEREYHFIGSEITLELRTRDESKFTSNYKIKGIALDDMFIYVGKDSIKDYIYPNVIISSLLIKEEKQNELVKIFNTFSTNNKDYVSSTIYTDSIQSVNKTIKKVKPIMIWASIIFLIFSIVLFMNYISTSINQNKKKIGILRSLGSRKSDIFKIFFLESFVIGIISLILSSILEILFIKFANIYVSRNLFSQIEPVVFNIDTIIYLIITVILVVFITSFISIYKIAKMNPIDAINNK